MCSKGFLSLHVPQVPPGTVVDDLYSTRGVSELMAGIKRNPPATFPHKEADRSAGWG